MKKCAGMELGMQYEEIKNLIEVFDKTSLNDLELCLDNMILRLNRESVAPWIQNTGASAGASEKSGTMIKVNAVQDSAPDVAVIEPKDESSPNAAADAVKEITSPIVGTFYTSSAPGNPPFVKVGDIVSEGDVVCIIEAMKFMNEINSEVSGTITEILVEDGEYVEYGQALFRLK